MNSDHKIALELGLNWIKQNFNYKAIFVSGSIIRGNPNKNSDFDVYVVNTDNFRQRIQKYFNEIPFEIFVNPLKQIYSYFEEEQNSNRPVTANIISTGKLVKGEDIREIQLLIEDAKKYSQTPKSKTEIATTFLKYEITNTLEDALDIENEDAITANLLTNITIEKLIKYKFYINEIPLPRIKERLKELSKIDESFWKNIEQFYTELNYNKKIRIAEQLVNKEIGAIGFFEWESKKEKIESK
ncbi:MAG: hypothetical protein MUE53_04550 [Chitinophagales bacterium]|nr:hypothetical protein [Chitinophagales bacterium]